jgi:hypothetical protein
MATKKPSKGGRAAATRAKRAARPRAAGRKANAAAVPQRKQKPRVTAKAAKPSKPTAKRGAAVAESKELLALKNKFQRERSALEKNLTEAVREIGMLRHHEMRAMQLERQIKERDDLIGRLQKQLEELQRRPIEPIYEREVQQSFALTAPAHEDVDEYALSGASEDAELVDESELEDEEA